MEYLMKLRELELLHSLMTLGTVSDAARMLHMSQPNASKMLKKLESDFGFSLFERLNGRLHPTEEARMMFDHVEQTLRTLKRFNALTEDIREMHTGSLAIGGLPLLSRQWLPRALGKFMKSHPGVVTTLHTRSSKKLIEWVAERHIDIAVGMLMLDDPMVERSVLTSFEFVAAIPKSHALAARETIEARDLHGQDFISLSVLDHTRDKIFRHLADAHTAPRERAECSLPTVAIELVAQSIGIALVDHISATETRLDTVCYRRFAPTIRMDVWLMRPRMRPRSRVVDEFVTHLHDSVEAHRLSEPSAALFVD
ncbi:MAG: LysR family transcriptional regulator [Proteobacteria bacterium]|nr:MAG: LysR family transcriptional regulator [Pseudomonadota bacterium]